MNVLIKNEQHVRAAIASLSKLVLVKDGRASWPMFETDHHEFVLTANIQSHPKIDEQEKRGLIFSVLGECAQTSNFKYDHFLRLLRTKISALPSKDHHRYIVTAQINIPLSIVTPRRIPSIFGPIRTSRGLSAIERSRLEKEPLALSRLQSEEGFLSLRTEVKARSPRSATLQGHRNLEFCVGVLNLTQGHFGPSVRFGMPSVPLGSLLVASTTLLIDPARRSVGEWAVSSQYPHPFRQSFTARSIDLVEAAKLAGKWVRQIRKTDFSDRLTTAIVIFQQGLAASQVDVALIKFWTCIELMCARDTKESLSHTIDRAAGIFPDRSDTRQRLEIIAEARHALVHRGESGDEALMAAQWASAYAAALIGFGAFNVHDLRHHTEVLDYLSTPQSIDRTKLVLKAHNLKLKVLQKSRSLASVFNLDRQQHLANSRTGIRTTFCHRISAS